MEIKDYLQILGRRARTLVGVPLLAVVLVVGYLAAQPQQYEATATVTATALVGGDTQNQYSGANGLKAFVSNFTAAVTSPPILEKVSSETGVRKRAIRAGISARQLGTSSLMQVAYRTPRRDKAVPVARSAASATIVFLFQTQLTLAERSVEAASKALEQSETALADLASKVGLVPDKTYQARADQLSRLQDLQTEYRIAGNTLAAGRLQPTIDAKQGEIAGLVRQVLEYQRLVDRKNQAMTKLAGVEDSLRSARSQFEAANPERVVSVGPSGPVPILGDVVQKGGVALGAGVFLAVGIVILLELVLPARSRVPEGVEAPAPSPEPVPSRA